MSDTYFLLFLAFFSFFAFFAIAKDPPSRADARRRVSRGGCGKNHLRETLRGALFGSSLREFWRRAISFQKLSMASFRLAHTGLIDPRGRLDLTHFCALALARALPRAHPRPRNRQTCLASLPPPSRPSPPSRPPSTSMSPAPSTVLPRLQRNGTASSALNDAIKRNPLTSEPLDTNAQP